MNKQLAKQMFMQGYSCSQSVACAFAEECNMTVDQLKKVAIAFGGGFVHQHSLCGALTGGALVAGIIKGGVEPNSKMDFAVKFEWVVDDFVKKHGSLFCSELVADKSKLFEKADFSVATEEEYKARPCLALVMSVVDMVADYISK